MKFKRLLSVMLATAMITTAVGCVQLDKNGNPMPTPTPAPIKTESELFDDFLMDSFREIVGDSIFDCRFMMRHPENYGINEPSLAIGSIDFEDYDKSEERWQEDYDELTSFDETQLTDKQKLIYDVIMHDIENSKEVLGLKYLDEINSPLLGIQSQLPSLLAEYKLYSVEDAFDYIEMLNSIGDYFGDMLTYQQKRSEKGYFMSDAMADNLIKSCENIISQPDKNELVIGFPKRIKELPSITKEQTEELIALNKKAMTESVVPAYKDFIAGIKKLKGTGKNEGGLCGYEGGKTYYEYLVKSGTGSDKSIETIISMIEQELDKNVDAIIKCIEEDAEVLDRMPTLELDFKSSEEMMKVLQKKTERDFPQMAELKYDIKTIAPELEEHSSPAFYIIPQLDDTMNNSIYINNKYMKDDPVYAFTTLAHEGYPGHMYQNCYFSTTNPHPIWRLISSAGYAEGWASYVENLSYEMTGIDDKQAIALMQAFNNRALMMSSRVDIGVNYEGWDKAQVKKYLAPHGFDKDETVESIYSSVVENPSNYLIYAVGFLEMQRLRENAEMRLDENFDAMGFHKAILDVGPAPFVFVQKSVEQYIWNRKLEVRAADEKEAASKSTAAA